jgi:ubiquinol-cytochrome c reductase cytochrome b subunit
MVTTYWGFYISPDTTKALVARLVIDPVFFYAVMLLLVPIGFGFSYMMIKLAKEAERKAKIAASKGPHKVAQINLSGKWINWLIVALLAFQVYLNIAAYNAALSGMKNFSLFLVGLILMVFAGMFHLYRHGLSEAKKVPIPPPQATAEIPKPIGTSPESATTLPGKENPLSISTPNTIPAPKINTTDQENIREPTVGTSDLKKP